MNREECQVGMFCDIQECIGDICPSYIKKKESNNYNSQIKPITVESIAQDVNCIQELKKSLLVRGYMKLINSEPIPNTFSIIVNYRNYPLDETLINNWVNQHLATDNTYQINGIELSKDEIYKICRDNYVGVDLYIKQLT